MPHETQHFQPSNVSYKNPLSLINPTHQSFPLHQKPAKKYFFLSENFMDEFEKASVHIHIIFLALVLSIHAMQNLQQEAEK